VVPSAGENAQQVEYWNQVAGPKWVVLSDRINEQIQALGHVALERAGIESGHRVVDIGCGCGHTTVDLAERVGETGSVLGVDVSEPMLAEARKSAAGMAQVSFESADAQSHEFTPGGYDRIFSRFGVMFFADPRAAFENLWRALGMGGRLTFLCWQEIAKNPWMAIPGAAAAKCVELPRPASPHAPGPFAFADSERVLGLLEEAGFGSLNCESLERPMTIGRGLNSEQLVEFSLQMGPAGAAMREADESLRESLRASVAEAIEPYRTAEGMVMDSATWIVSAEKTPA
jgi:SAM-dependent methyltransferase